MSAFQCILKGNIIGLERNESKGGTNLGRRSKIDQGSIKDAYPFSTGYEAFELPVRTSNEAWIECGFCISWPKS